MSQTDISWDVGHESLATHKRLLVPKRLARSHKGYPVTWKQNIIDDIVPFKQCDVADP